MRLTCLQALSNGDYLGEEKHTIVVGLKQEPVRGDLGCSMMRGTVSQGEPARSRRWGASHLVPAPENPGVDRAPRRRENRMLQAGDALQPEEDLRSRRRQRGKNSLLEAHLRFTLAARESLSRMGRFPAVGRCRAVGRLHRVLYIPVRRLPLVRAGAAKFKSEKTVSRLRDPRRL